MIRPIKIFFYFLLIALLAGIIYHWLDKTGISLIPDVDISPPQKAEENDLASQLLPEETLPREDSVSEKRADTIISSNNGRENTHPQLDSVLTAPADFLRQYDSFRKKATEAHRRKTVVRVMHIGDSQIEGDRITNILRQHFQDLYGGSGPGYIMPYDPLRVNATVRLRNSGTWNLEYSYRQKSYPAQIGFGFSGKAAWYSGQEASFTISPLPWESKRLGQYPNIRLLITPRTDSFKMHGTTNGNSVSDTIVPASDHLQILSFQSGKTHDELKFTYTSGESPVFHGITLDGNSGIAVDNISMRGRPWPGIRLADNEMLQDMGEQLNIGFIIIQFGTNVLPTITDDYNFYRVHFQRELTLLQNLLPGIPVLVIGVQAAATVRDGTPRPLEHAALISEAQRSAALASGMAFFDLYKVMGGKSGAVDWTARQPPLMLSDYMHFSNRGARKVGNRIWSALNSLSLDSVGTDANQPAE